MAKVIRGGSMFFKDDIQIVDAEVEATLNLPSSPIFSRDEFQILYNGHIFTMTEEVSDDAEIKVYTLTFGLQETESPKILEDRYFSDNSNLIKSIKQDFIERVVNGISVLDDTYLIKESLRNQLGAELINRIMKQYSQKIQNPQEQKYAGKGLITELNDSSVFNSEMTSCERVVILDSKVYDLMTISEYIEKFKRSFEPSFYEKVQKACISQTPQEISDLLSENKEYVHREILPRVRNKIWHSERSFRLFLDGTYWTPQYRDTTNELKELYRKLLEKRVKIDAVSEKLK